MLPFTSLSQATTAPAVGVARDLEASLGNHTMLLTVTGSPPSWQVALEGSHDGQTWFFLNAGGSSSGPLVHATQVVRHIRARLSSLTGGESPSVSATIASV
ncbi:hypothetical protein O7630_34500 [Micromonospora sp. WMMD718]|uniref:hypothetical protein n=1 Tax=Micromonospora sp. WMMD718 TaxID=3016098 RepID=UPI0024172984|nr:hypothetical protein [Micromonospora sp. WMMD718]MDG4756057.1 hypothetical protein [Micromonospora sp. WMMD718]